MELKFTGQGVDTMGRKEVIIMMVNGNVPLISQIMWAQNQNVAKTMRIEQILRRLGDSEPETRRKGMDLLELYEKSYDLLMNEKILDKLAEVATHDPVDDLWKSATQKLAAMPSKYLRDMVRPRLLREIDAVLRALPEGPEGQKARDEYQARIDWIKGKLKMD